MKAITRLSTTTIHDQLFIDDCALNIMAEEDLQRNVDLFAAGCTKCGLTIKTDKTVVMHQPSPDMEHNSARITVNGNQLQTMDNFAYLGGIISYNTNIDDEVAGRLSEASKPASKAFRRLQASVCSRHSLHLNSKLEMYKAVVLRTLLYGVETWIVYASHARKPNHFHLNCLCRMLKLRWYGRVPNPKILEGRGILDVCVILRQLRLRWSGHLVRMDDARLPKQLFYGDVVMSACRPGGPKRRYKDTLKNSLKRVHINPETWEFPAYNRLV
ncbi:hypothetical protein SprV_0100176900 [Sparganum proliferum]